MRPGTKPNSVSPLCPYHRGTITNIEAGSIIQGAQVCAGTTKDGAICWITKGPVIEVVATKNCNRLASWTFGAILKDTNTCIVSVREYRCGRILRLLVGVNCSSQSSMLCVLDVSLSKVLRAVEIPRKVTYIEPVTSFGGDFIPMWALNEQLRQFHGIVAVGTEGGIVYLVDMCLDDEENFSNEIAPNKLQFISPRSRDVPQRRTQALSKGQHLCMVLDEGALNNDDFLYRRCDGTVNGTFTTDYVKVTCLKYIPQIGNLVVGFNFGCYQLWKLHVPVLEYSSRIEAESFPVTRIAYQEPENDPKNFCYVWIARDPTEEGEEGLSSLSLYQLAYNKKTWYSNYGAFYEELTSVCLMFDLDLTATPLTPAVKTTISSRIITCYTLENPNYEPPTRLAEDESFEESVHGPDLSLFIVAWESSDGQSARDTCHMGVFDMNRWYHAQMPSSVRNVHGAMDTCPYMSSLSLDDAADIAVPDMILAVHVGTDKLRRFINTSPMPPEQHFYPSSLSFEALLLTDGGLLKADFLGTQRQVLENMQKIGPSILLNPKELYSLCMYMGLLPRPLSLSSHNPSQVEMRESLLSLALEYTMLGFIMSCVREWADGEYVHVGCTLKFILDWVWEKVSQIKNTIDNTSYLVCLLGQVICSDVAIQFHSESRLFEMQSYLLLCAGMQLYDGSSVTLDQRSMQTLYESHQKLDNLTSFFRALLYQSIPVTEQGFVDLQNKLCALNYLTQHLQIVLWFVRIGLLPEMEEVEENGDHHYSYPAANVVHAYKLRREELQKLPSEDSSLLMIDGLIEEMGSAVKTVWLRKGGDGMYPPPSLNALLDIYLLDDVDLMSKHRVVLYLLLDLVSMMNQQNHQQFADKIGKFHKKFSIPLSVLKQVQGWWLLDHGDCEESISVMLDPMISKEIGGWQHCKIIKSLLYQGNGKTALRYLTTKQPTMTTTEEVKLKITVLVACRLTGKALQYLRTCKEQASVKDMLFHLFRACQQMKTMDQLLQLPLMESEEGHLVDYLSESSEQHLKELLIWYFLQRARYVEAIRLNEKMKQTVPVGTNTKARERVASRNAILDGFFSTLPKVQRQFIFEKGKVLKQSAGHRREVHRPKPLSTTVRKVNENTVVSKSTFLFDAMEKVQEINSEETQKQSQSEDPAGPFIGTPITPKVLSRISNSQSVTYPVPQDMGTVTPWKSSALTPFSGSKAASPLVFRLKTKLVGAELLKLLKTPEIRKKTPSKKVQPSSIPTTPQSILKVRTVVASSTSPATPSADNSRNDTVDWETKVIGKRHMPKKLGYGELLTPRSVSFVETPPTTTPKQLQYKEPAKTLELTVPLQSALRTPKGRRSPKSPPSPRSLKDRSPTPENISRSPKQFSKFDNLRRKPLHGRDLVVIDAETSTSVAADRMEQDEVVDNDITFHFKQEKGEGDKDDGSSELAVPMEVLDTGIMSPSEQSVPKQGSELSQADISGKSYTQLRDMRLERSLKLRQSPLVKGSPTRSPTVKLSKSPARVKFMPKYQQLEDDIKPEASEVKSDRNDTNEVSSSHQQDDDSPIEIDLTLDEEGSSEGGTPSKEEISTDLRVKQANDVISSSISPSFKVRQKFSPSMQESSAVSSSVIIGESCCEAVSMETSSTEHEIISEEMEQKKHVSFTTENVTVEEIKQAVHPETEPAVSSVNTGKIQTLEEDKKTELEQTSGRKSKSPSPKRSPKRPQSPEKSPKSHELTIAIPESSTEASVSPRKSPRLQEKRNAGSPGSDKQPVSVDVSPSSSKQPKLSSKEVDIPPKSTAPLTPTRRSSRLLEGVETRSPAKTSTPTKRLSRAIEGLKMVTESSANDIESDVFESRARTRSTRSLTPVLTPTRRSSRVHSKCQVDTLSEESKKNIDNDGEQSAKRKGRKKADKGSEASLEGPATPRRGHKKLDKSEMPVLESMEKSDDISTVTGPKTLRKSVIEMPELESMVTEEIVEPTTPTRRGRKQIDKSVLTSESLVDKQEDIVEEPTTPTRRGRKKVDKSVLNSESLVDKQEDTVEEPTTPTRRGRKKVDKLVLNSESLVDKQEDIVEPTTPTRRSRKKVDKSVLNSESLVDKQEDIVEEPTTPTRRGRKKVDKSVLNSESLVDKQEDIVEEPTTPTRRGRKKVDKSVLNSESLVDKPEDIVEPTTPTRRGRKKVDKSVLNSESLVDKQEDIVEEPTTPTRRGRKKVDKSVLNSESLVEKQEDIVEPTTPTRRGRRMVEKSPNSTSENVQEIVSTSQPAKKKNTSKVEKTEEETAYNEEKGKKEKMRKEEKRSVLQRSNKDHSMVGTKIPLGSLVKIQSSVLTTVCPDSSFTFADPKEVDYIQQEEHKPPTPLKSFIFSPPISQSGGFHRDTTTKRRIPRELELKEEAIQSALPHTHDPPASLTTTVAQKSKISKRRKKKVEDEETILLISPMTPDDEIKPRPRRQLRQKTLTESKKVDTLETRTRKYTRKRPAKLW